MKDLVEGIKKLRKSDVGYLVKGRMREFEEKGAGTSDEMFKELCFCILCANYNAERGIAIQEKIGEGFLTLRSGRLAQALRRLGYRYPETRAKYIVKAREYKDSLKQIVEYYNSDMELREWLVGNVTGIGCKEASHFMRNIGRIDVSIIDFHILDVLERYGLVVKPRTLTKRRYMEIEHVLRGIAQSADLSLGELDLYLWYMETGKILK